jgi:hypothetical protein
MSWRASRLLSAASTVALAAAALVSAAASWNALRIDPLPSIEPSPPGAMPALDGLLAATQRDSTASASLESDPFSADRTLPDDADAGAVAEPVAVVPAAEVRLLGTVVRGSSPFALCQLPSDAPRIVHVGERIGDLTLVSLDQGRATFHARTGAQVELTLFKPGS